MERKLSEKYEEKLIPINITGVAGVAWGRDLVLEFLKSEECKSYAILGGDVIRVSGSKMEYTYDSWSIDRKRTPTESFSEFSERCRARTFQYISAYPVSNDVLFALVMSSEATAGL